MLTFGTFQLDPGQRALREGNEPVRLVGYPLDILIALAEQAGHVVTKSELLNRIWRNSAIPEGTLRAHITTLRKALGRRESDIRYIENVAGQGYCLTAPVSRHQPVASPEAYRPGCSFATFGPFQFIPFSRSLLRADKILPLGSRAREILLVLIERPGVLVAKRELSARVWTNTVVEEGALRVHVAALRRTLGDREGGPRYIETVHGIGYRFVAPVSRFETSASATLSELNTTETKRIEIG
jgi:DNA-binding winged helix-turn-helix (wHTH) protein